MWPLIALAAIALLLLREKRHGVIVIPAAPKLPPLFIRPAGVPERAEPYEHRGYTVWVWSQPTIVADERWVARIFRPDEGGRLTDLARSTKAEAIADAETAINIAIDGIPGIGGFSG